MAGRSPARSRARSPRRSDRQAEQAKFKTRYATFGFPHAANLDEDVMWPVAFALKDLTAAEEARIIALVKKAVS